MAIDRKANSHSDKVMTKNLTELEILFANKYIANQGNLTKTAEQCQLSRPTCYAYLKKEGIKQYLEILTSIGIKEDIATTDELLQVLSDIALGKVKDEIFDFKNGKVVEILPNAISRNQAITTLLKQRGELSNKLELTQNNLYLNAPVDKLDLTSLIECKKEVKEIPNNIDFEEIGGIDAE